jgi:hypothetical protein
LEIAIKGAGWENGNLDVVVQNLAQIAEEAKDDLGQVEGRDTFLPFCSDNWLSAEPLNGNQQAQVRLKRNQARSSE